VPILLLPPLASLDPAQIAEKKKEAIYMQYNETFRELKARLESIANLRFGLQNAQVRLWKSNSLNSKPLDFAKFL
jgi:hypothetical protein